MAEAIVFWTLAVLILGLGIAVISARSAVHSVLFLVVNFLLVAVLYVTLNAEFVAVIQVLVYAGGIVVLYLFVVMLVNLKKAPERYADPRRVAWTGTLLAGVVLAEVIAIVFSSGSGGESAAAGGGFGADTPFAECGAGPLVSCNTEQLGWVLYTSYLIPFELASMLLLVAMIGAIVLAKRHL
ncbi:MAG: NADH-quinone oxidoreductase subunit J [Acidobacteria bacterium]|nr:NADH-quinone oxidoreductase subunit J [Acidobacteriota bacterium]